MTDLTDARLVPARPDLADIRLQGRVGAARYVAGRSGRLVAASAPLRRRPSPDAGIETEAVMGDPVTLYDTGEGFAFVQLVTDGYVGYLPETALALETPAPSHRVTALRTFLYPAANMKRPPLGHVSLGAGLGITGREGDFLRLADDAHVFHDGAFAGGAYVFADHCAPAGIVEPDPAATAERLVGTPYLWGGRTSLGLDCSGLVQLCLALAGIPSPRDADQQEAALGTALPTRLDGLARGDLVFWRGHVGMMLDETRLIHANGHHMAVAVEPLAVAVERIAEKSYGAVTSIRRITPSAGS
ncbi:NlpC/P60 family protein [Methylobacterium sp. W2]|uniref:C40 family peptidase n=1 Tax=Methylobacterium sp. W2 TaxID=2598107 RepID=UPI001D0BFE35|nr:C40 family peptidase [Methylobacterium sp. W2]MCC0805561.1 NlpC/P60 family protein [Methylobacterium sp. W2]